MELCPFDCAQGVDRFRATSSASTFPAGPGTGESSTPCTSSPCSSIQRRIPSIASRRAWGSRTTPPFPTFSRPTSNCGYTRATRSPPGSSFGSTAGSTCRSEMKLTSITTTPTGSGRSSQVR